MNMRLQFIAEQKLLNPSIGDHHLKARLEELRELCHRVFNHVEQNQAGCCDAYGKVISEINVSAEDDNWKYVGPEVDSSCH